MLQSKESTHTPRLDRADRLTRWSWAMVPTFVVVYFVSSAAYLPVLLARGQREGDLLAMTEDVAGVALEVLFAIVFAAAPVTGVVLAARALRRHVTHWAQAALVANGLLVLVATYQFVDAIRMSFFAPLD